MIKYAPKVWGLALFLILNADPFSCFSQQLTLLVEARVFNEKIALDTPLISPEGDTLTISTMKFYLGDIAFWKDGRVLFADRHCHLLDWEAENATRLVYDLPDGFTFDSLCFNLGTDSLSNVSGALSGDLDPVKGMFWTWQSGYINVKLEGISSKCPARKGAFALHLGGYLPPYQTLRQVKIGGQKQEKTSIVQIELDLTTLFQKIDWQKKPNIMSPGKEAAQLMDVLAKSFLWHEQ